MPISAPRPCRRPGCPAVTRDRSGYCDAHRAASPAAQARRAKRSDPFYHSTAWARLRAAYLRANPLCADPLGSGCHNLASLVDHRTPLSAGGAALDEQNLRSLCPSCHARLAGHGWRAHSKEVPHGQAPTRSPRP